MEGLLGLELSLLWTLPFAGLLLCIAILPLAAPHFWGSNANKAVVAAVFGLPVLLMIGAKAPHELAHTGIEYFSFIVLLGALFIIAGGICLKGDIEATPMTNTLFLLGGAVLANLIGTTGASMLMIRPVLHTNRERKHTVHIPIFFIFLVSNIGGSLTPVGDPPLFLGYLQGVPFFWTLKLFPEWAFAVAVLLAVFYAIDRRAYGKESEADLLRDAALVEPLKIRGGLNFLWLGGVLAAAIFLPTPVREGAMIALALASWFATDRQVHRDNEFSFHPLVEVAVLFLGIFSSMIPCLLMLKARGAELGITQPWQFFWTAGALSSFLDNAPTYMTFLSLGQGVTQSLGLAGNLVSTRGGDILEPLLKAVSLGAVFMGANTYIGNAPNFMVKSISDQSKVRMPSFFGYMLWSGAVLLPLFAAITFIFFI
jgi:Na+/H+ antiporter NhaD/arsenite permease-like protein